MENYISAYGSLFTVIAILFGLWYGEIQSIKSVILSQHDEDNINKYEDIKNCLFGKAIPLAVINTIMIALFMPVVLSELTQSFTLIKTGNAIYDPIQASFVFTLLLSLVLDCLLFEAIYSMVKKIMKTPNN